MRRFDVRVSLFRSLFCFGVGVHGGFQLMNGMAQALAICPDHLGFELVKGDIEVVRDMRGGDELPKILKAGAGNLQVCARQQRLKSCLQMRVVGDLLIHGWSTATALGILCTRVM